MEKENAVHARLGLAGLVTLMLWGVLLWVAGVGILRWTASLGALTGAGQIIAYALTIIGTVPLIPISVRLGRLPQSAALTAVAVPSMTALLIDGVVIGYYPWVYSPDPALARACAGALLWAVGVALALGLAMGRRGGNRAGSD